MKKIKLMLFSGSLMMLAACQSTQMTQPEQWQTQRPEQNFDASGRLGVKINEKGSYANFDWSRQNGVETIDVNTPVGNTVGQLCRDKLGVLAKDANGKIYTADTPEALSEQLLGYNLPIEHMATWANGERVPNESHHFNAQGKLQQLGWTISRELNEDNTPRILLLENAQMSIRMAFTHFETTQTQPESPTQCTARN